MRSSLLSFTLLIFVSFVVCARNDVFVHKDKFDSCSVVAYNGTDPSFVLSWSKNATYVRIGVAARSNGWVGFGIGDQMEGSDAVIGRMNNNVMQVIDYYLEGQSQCGGGSGVCPDTTFSGTNDVKSVSGARNRTTGVTSFTFERLLKTADTNNDKDIELAAASYLWAIGSTDTINKHTRKGIFSNDFSLVDAPCPVSAGVQCGTNGECHRGCCICNDGWTGPSCAVSTSGVTPTPPPTPTDLTPEINPADYQLSVDLSSDFKVYWKVDAVAQTIEFAVEVKATGWIAFGPDVDSEMTNSDPVIGWIDDAGKPVINDYFIGSLRGDGCPNGICLDTDNGGTNDVLAMNGNVNNGVTQLKWIRKLKTDDATKDYAINANGDTKVIWAFHPTEKGPDFSKHLSNTKGTSTINFSSGSAKTTDESAIRKAHGALMFIAWAIIVPITSFIARYLKKYSWWFNVHRFANFFAIVLVIISFILALIFTDKDSHFDDAHKIIGLIVVIFTVFQPIVGILADKYFDVNRTATPIWPDKIHWFIGWGLLTLAMINIILGILAYDDVVAPINKGVLIAYCVYAGVVYLFLIAFFVYRLVTGAPTHHAQEMK